MAPAPLVKKQIPITIDTGLFTITVHKPVYGCEHGPVVKTAEGAWAIRYGGIGRAILSGEQWYRMNKAHHVRGVAKGDAHGGDTDVQHRVRRPRARSTCIMHSSGAPRGSTGWRCCPATARSSGRTTCRSTRCRRSTTAVRVRPGCNSTPWKTTTGDANRAPRPSTRTSASRATSRTARCDHARSSERAAPSHGTSSSRSSGTASTTPTPRSCAEVPPLKDVALADRRGAGGPRHPQRVERGGGRRLMGASIAILTWRGVTPITRADRRDRPTWSARSATP